MFKTTTIAQINKIEIPIIELSHNKNRCMGFVIHTAKVKLFSPEAFQRFIERIRQITIDETFAYIQKQIERCSFFFERLNNGRFVMPTVKNNNGNSKIKKTKQIEVIRRRHMYPKFAYPKDALNWLLLECARRNFTIQALESLVDIMEGHIRIEKNKNKFRRDFIRYKQMFIGICSGKIRPIDIELTARRVKREKIALQRIELEKKRVIEERKQRILKSLQKKEETISPKPIKRTVIIPKKSSTPKKRTIIQKRRKS